MKEITAYRLSDGTIVEDKAEAERRERVIRFEAEAMDFADKYGTYEGKDQIFTAIAEHSDELMKILEKLKD
jgi:hypothetical protein